MDNRRVRVLRAQDWQARFLAEQLIEAVLEKVASIQFDSVEEFGRQLGLDDPLPPVPFTKQQQDQTWSAEVAGVLEDDDLGVKPPPVWAPKTLSSEYGPERWAFDEPQGPRPRRAHVPVVPPELDPHQVGRDYRESRQAPLTGAQLSIQPDYRRKPPYVTLPDGTSQIWMLEELRDESKKWARRFAADARRCFIRSHIHKCMDTCYKHRGGGAGGDPVRVCRFNFNHEYHVVVYARRPPPRECRLGGACPLHQNDVRLVTDPEQRVHPQHCPVHPQAGELKKWLRRGKELVLPREGEPGKPFDFRPHVSESTRYGSLGRAMVLRYNPSVSSSNPAGQVVVRCNWDVQCFDRVYVVAGKYQPAEVQGCEQNGRFFSFFANFNRIWDNIWTGVGSCLGTCFGYGFKALGLHYERRLKLRNLSGNMCSHIGPN